MTDTEEQERLQVFTLPRHDLDPCQNWILFALSGLCLMSKPLRIDIHWHTIIVSIPCPLLSDKNTRVTSSHSSNVQILNHKCTFLLYANIIHVIWNR